MQTTFLCFLIKAVIRPYKAFLRPDFFDLQTNIPTEAIKIPTDASVGIFASDVYGIEHNALENIKYLNYQSLNRSY